MNAAPVKKTYTMCDQAYQLFMDETMSYNSNVTDDNSTYDVISNSIKCNSNCNK